MATRKQPRPSARAAVEPEDAPTEPNAFAEPAPVILDEDPLVSAPVVPPVMFEAPRVPGAIARTGRDYVLCVGDQYEWPVIREAVHAQRPGAFPTIQVVLAGLMEGDTISAGLCLNHPTERRPNGSAVRAVYLTAPIPIAEHWNPGGNMGVGEARVSSLLSVLGQAMIPHAGRYGGANTRIKDGFLRIEAT